MRPQGPGQGQFQGQPQGQFRPQGQNQSPGQFQRPGGAQQGRGYLYAGRRHDQIQAPGYNYPRGYGYRRWGVGQSLPLFFLNEEYFFDSYSDYGFGAPPYGYHWLRYGPDLLLVADQTGRIAQVIYGVFY